MKTVIYTAAIDTRFEHGKVSSRIGLEADAILYDESFDFLSSVNELIADEPLHCVFIDEAQFVTKSQVKQLTKIVDILNIPVLAYGLRTDFLGETFSGSHYLLAWADKLFELKTICHCGKKANFVVRFDEHGKPMREGDQILVGDNDVYQSMCRKHFRELVWD